MPILCDWCYYSQMVRTRVFKKLTMNCVIRETRYKKRTHRDFCLHFKPHEAVVENIRNGEGCGITFWVYYPDLHFKIKNKFRKAINKKEK